MKHKASITTILIIMFLIAQIIGITLIAKTANIEETEGQITVDYGDTTLGERPQTNPLEMLIYMLIGVLIGTLILLYFAKKKKITWWKTWFLLASIIAMSVSIGALTNNYMISWIIAAILGYLKLYKPNPPTHNLTEILMYTGIAIIIAPHLSVLIGAVLLILFSIYDAYAVWKSKHMITMARFTTKAKVFPGFCLDYTNKNKNISEKKQGQKEKRTRTGILGGGDVVLPMLFFSSILISLLSIGYTKQTAIYLTLIPILTTTFALIYLFVTSKPSKFYPAMPYLTTGALIGYGIISLII